MRQPSGGFQKRVRKANDEAQRGPLLCMAYSVPSLAAQSKSATTQSVLSRRQRNPVRKPEVKIQAGKSDVVFTNFRGGGWNYGHPELAYSVTPTHYLLSTFPKDLHDAPSDCKDKAN